MNAHTSTDRSPWMYFALVFAISIPLWLAGGSLGPVLPGVPLSSVVVTFCPAIAAAILIWTKEGVVGVRLLLERAFDFRRISAKGWYLPVFLLMPSVMFIEYWLLRWTGSPIPPPTFPVWMPLAMFAVFFLTSLGEELGWTGYAMDPMQRRFAALPAGVLLGIVWSAWHITPVVQVGRPVVWIAWQCLFWVGMRVLFVWIYNNTGGSVAAAAALHSMLNVATYLFPVGGTFYDPRLTALIVVAAAAMVTLVWGPKRLRCGHDDDFAAASHSPARSFRI